MLLLASKGSCEWLVSLICNDPGRASGGCHRSLQLLDILKRDGWQINTVKASTSGSRWDTLRKGVFASLAHGALQPYGLDSLRSHGHAAHHVEELHRRLPRLKGVIQEGTGYGSLTAVAQWRQRGVRTVLVPANVESLAPNISSWTHRGLDINVRFAHERRWWAMADAIFTISIEEAWWLQLHGIKAEWLPYYPAPEREQQLLKIREQRRPNPNTGWLWLADFGNPANYMSIQLTLDWLKECKLPPKKLQIIGRGSENIFSTMECSLPPYAVAIGEISDEQLGFYYRHCTKQLIIHRATSGMLTRIIDTSLAGIPIIANIMALKSYAHLCNDLEKPQMPRFPESQILSFLATIKSLSF